MKNLVEKKWPELRSKDYKVVKKTKKKRHAKKKKIKEVK